MDLAKEVENVGAEQKPASHVAWITILKLMGLRMAEIGEMFVVIVLCERELPLAGETANEWERVTSRYFGRVLESVERRARIT